MMRFKRASLLLVVCLCLSLFSTSGVAQAHHADESPEPGSWQYNVLAAFQLFCLPSSTSFDEFSCEGWWNNAISEEQRDYIRHLPSVSSYELTESTVETEFTAQGACNRYIIGVNAYTWWLENLAYRFWVDTSFCYDAGVLTSANYTYYLTDVDPFFSWQGTVSETGYYSGDFTSFTVFVQGNVGNCVGIFFVGEACGYTSYPTVGYTVFADGSYGGVTTEIN